VGERSEVVTHDVSDHDKENDDGLQSLDHHSDLLESNRIASTIDPTTAVTKLQRTAAS
jgi:hypothetical protein